MGQSLNVHEVGNMPNAGDFVDESYLFLVVSIMFLSEACKRFQQIEATD